MNGCKIDGCNGLTGGHTWCYLHRSNFERFGTPTPTCVAPGCTRGRRARPYCVLHYRIVAKYGTLERPKPLAAAPLLDYVALRGGVGACITAAGYLYGTLGYEQQQKRFDRVITEGSLSAAQADLIAIEIFGVHPSWIWGDAWFLDVVADLDDEQAVAS